MLTSSILRRPIVWYRHHKYWTSDDVIIDEYPKSGITWLRFLVYEALTRRPATWPDVNSAITDRSPAEPILSGGRRVIPSHEAYRRSYRKAIYLVRDARDIVSSEYAYQKGLGIFAGDFDAFIRAFVTGKVSGYGAWHKHIASWLDAADAGKVDLLVVRYEDMRANPEAKLAEIVRFCGAEADPAVIRAAVVNNSLENMRAKEDAARRTMPASGKRPLRKMQDAGGRNRFVREGAIAGWRGRLSEQQIRVIETHAGDALRRLGYPLSTDVRATQSAEAVGQR